MGTYNALGQPANYTIGGLRFFFDELVNTQYQGYLYLGNVVTGALTPTVDNLDHFTAKSGKRLKDRRVVREVGMGFNLTLDEPNAAAMNLFMFGAGVSDVAAAPATAVTGLAAVAEFHKGVIIPHKGASTIVVKEGLTTLVLNTDYTVTDILGYKKVTPIKVVREPGQVDAQGKPIAHVAAVQQHFDDEFGKVQMEKNWDPTPNEFCKYCQATKGQCKFSRKL